MHTQPTPPATLRWFEASSLSALLLDPLSEALSATLRAFIKEQRWFRGKARTLTGLAVLDVLPLRASEADELVLTCLRVQYDAGEPEEVYVLPLARHSDAPARAVLGLRLGPGKNSIVYDPSGSAELSNSLIQLYGQRLIQSARGVLHIDAHAALVTRLAPQADPLAAHALSGDQSNTTLFFGQELMLKLFRQLEDGMNPDVELSRFLWDHGFRHAPEPLGYVQYTSPTFQATLSAVQRYIPSQGTAWDVCRQALQRALLLVEQRGLREHEPALPKRADLLSSAHEAVPDSISELIGSLAPLVSQLAQRSAELHLCLASDTADPAFSPEPFDARYQRNIVQAAGDRLTRVFGLLRKQLPSLPAAHRPSAEKVLLLHGHLAHQINCLPETRIQADRIRCHGDYHLGQVLFTANDFVIIDFEGEPAQPLSVRRQKHSALYDVCGMLRSFHYAATVATEEVLGARHDHEERASLTRWSDAFYRWCSALFLCSYMTRAREQPGKAVFLPGNDDQLRALLRLHMLDKCAYELGYELNNRPDWLPVPLAGLSNLADQENR